MNKEREVDTMKRGEVWTTDFGKRVFHRPGTKTEISTINVKVNPRRRHVCRNLLSVGGEWKGPAAQQYFFFFFSKNEQTTHFSGSISPSSLSLSFSALSLSTYLSVYIYISLSSLSLSLSLSLSRSLALSLSLIFENVDSS
jgi:hypothetical protein